MALVLKVGVAEFGGELVELDSGVVLDPTDAYEAVEWRANSEPLGTRIPAMLHEPLRAQSRFPMLQLRDLAVVRARSHRSKASF